MEHTRTCTRGLDAGITTEMRAAGALGASGLDVELRCPRCGPHATLVELHNDAGESRCTFCAGSYIAARGMKKIFVELGGVAWKSIEQLAKKSRPGATRCPACHAQSAALNVGQTSADICPKCLTAWFAPGTLFQLAAGKYGARSQTSVERAHVGPAKRSAPAPASNTPSPRGGRPMYSPPASHISQGSHGGPAPGRNLHRPSKSSTSKYVLIFVLPLLLIGSAGAVYWWLVRGEKNPFIAAVPPPPPAEIKLVALVPEEAVPGGDSLADYPFGGRTAAAWSDRLTALKSKSDAKSRELYALTKQRALANGLKVDDTESKVSVHPSTELVSKIGSRFSVAADPQVTAETVADPASVNTSIVYRPSKKHARMIFARRETNTATLRIQFRAGAYDDAHRSGLTKLTQQAMLGANSVGDYQELMLDIFAANGKLELETGVRENAITLTAPAAQFEKLAKQLASMCLSAKIVSEGFEDAKSRALTQAQESNLDALVSAIARTVYSEPGYQNDPDGDKETIRALSVSDVSHHIAASMSPANATVIVAGKFDLKKFKTFLAKFSGGTQRAPLRPKGDFAGNYHLRSPFEVHLVAFPLALRSPRSVAAAHLAGALLQERIFHQFRKSGDAYAVLASPVHREWIDSVVLVLPLDSETSAPVGARLNEAVEQMKSGGIEDATLERNRRYLLADFADLDRSSRELAMELGVGAGELEWVGPKVYNEIATMTKADLLEELGEQLSASASIHVHFSPKSGAAAEKSVR